MCLARAESMRADLAARPRPRSSDGPPQPVDEHDATPTPSVQPVPQPGAQLTSDEYSRSASGIATPAELSTIPPWTFAPDEHAAGGYLSAPLDGMSMLPTWPESWMDLEDLLERLTSGTFAASEARSIDEAEGSDLL
jgi:hypothetical protein